MSSKDKDPAVLFYIANWLNSTAAMDADARGWYLNLMLHNYDKGGLSPNVEDLAQLACVRHSEFERFKHVLEHVLMQKFSINEDTGLLENPKTMKMLRSREEFKEKRSRSGNIGVVIKLAKSIDGYHEKHIELLKKDLYSYSDEKIEEAKSEQVLKQMLKLYINIIISINKSIYSNNDIEEPIAVSEELEIKKSELINLICEKYGYQENRFYAKKRIVMAFVDVTIKNESDYDYFVLNFNSYMDYKLKSEEKQHGFDGLFGTQSSQFTDGALMKENWEQKLLNLKTEKSTKFSRAAEAYAGAKNPYEQ